MKKFALLFVATLAFAFGLKAETRQPGIDPHSFSQPDKIITRHMDLNLSLDFEKEQINGISRLHLQRIQPVDELILDTSDLIIEWVTEGPSKTFQRKAVFKLEEKHAIFGSPLKINIRPDTKIVTIKYHTAPKAGQLGWLTPKQTLSGKMPFFFTASEPIESRMWNPCQDTPTVRVTYSARVQVPKGLLALMSADNPQKINPDGIYEFEMNQPIPSYLIALAVGELQFQALGKNMGIYAQPQMLEKAAKEFEDLPQMMETAEELFGAYQWDRYDALILPNHLPFEGMENPRLSFFAPSVLTGDKSGISILAHELAHSWSGNLVTNSNWGDLWLNEGFARYLERRILEKVYGPGYSEIVADTGLRTLRGDISSAGEDLEVTKLHVDIKDRNPRDYFTAVPYEKGYLFLKTLEEAIGKEKMNLFLTDYFESFYFKSVSSQDFIDYLRKTLFAEDPTLEEKISLEEWIFAPGMPSRFPTISPSILTEIKENVDKWRKGTSAEGLKISGWQGLEKSTFLSLLPSKIPLERLRELDKVFGFSQTNNLTMLRWWVFRLIASGDVEHYDLVEDFLKYRAGSTKGCVTVYSRLAQSSSEGKLLAERIYSEAKESYLPRIRAKIEALLKNNNRPIKEESRIYKNQPDLFQTVEDFDLPFEGKINRFDLGI